MLFGQESMMRRPGEGAWEDLIRRRQDPTATRIEDDRSLILSRLREEKPPHDVPGPLPVGGEQVQSTELNRLGLQEAEAFCI